MDQRSGNILKIAVAVIAVIAAAGIAWMNLRGESPLPDSIEYVDVVSGKLYRISRSSAPKVLPGENPDTKQRTLVPVVREESGEYSISERKLGVVRDLGEINKVVDVKTRRVAVAK